MTHIAKHSSAQRVAPRSWVRTLAGLGQFSRPHTIVATSFQVITMWLIVGGLAAISAPAVAALCIAWLACLALNIFVVGINQVIDVPIDRINKPWLPLASNIMRSTTAQVISWAAAGLSVLLAALAGPYLLGTVSVILLIGAAYSLPPVRWKRFPIVAALSIAFARGFLANVGLGVHFAQVLDRPLPVALVGAVGVFFFGFGLVIALYKDLPDAPGDRAAHITTFTTRLGSRRVVTIGRIILGVCYAALIGFALMRLPAPGAWFLLVSHIVLIGLFQIAAARVDLDMPRSIRRFYLLLWLLFYGEFALLAGYAITRSIV